MRIVICGAGEVGGHAAEVLALDGHSVTIVDVRAERLSGVSETHDVRTLTGNSTHAEVLIEAGCRKADLLIAATSSDEINLLTCAIAKAVGVRRRVARVHHSAFFERRGMDYAAVLGVDQMVCPEYSTAVAIAQTLRSPGSLAVEEFARGRIDMRTLSVSDRAKALESSLAGLKMPESARVVLVEGKKGAYIPDGQTVIDPGDRVTLIADAADFDRARQYFNDTPRQRESVIVLGGTAQGVWLCRQLQGGSFTIRLFEQDRARAEELAGKLDWVTVLCADMTDPAAYEEEHIDKADVFVSASDDDENNILAAARAKSMGVRTAVAIVQRPTYLRLLRHVGIDFAFSPRYVAVDQILAAMNQGPVKRLAVLSPQAAVLMSVRVGKAVAGVTDRALRDVTFGQKVVVAAVQRGDWVRVPGARDTIEVGDELILVAPPAMESTLRKMFAV